MVGARVARCDSILAKEAARVPEPQKNTAGPQEKAEGASPKPPQEGTPETQPAEVITPEAREMATGCFERGQQATVRGNFDYAMHLYLDGMRYNPTDVEGHKGLRECALKRRSVGKGGGLGALLGQAKGAWSQMLGRQKDAMLERVEALGRDPQNVTLLMQIMQTARRLDYVDVAIWYGEIAAEETLKTRKPQKQVFTTLADMYESQRRFQDAVNALTTAIKIDPADRMLDKRARDLSASASIEDGKLESVSDFHDMVRDRRQAAASATQQVVRTREQLDAQYKELKAEYDADPKNLFKLQALAECQWRRGDVDDALGLLSKALESTKEYRFKFRMDDIRMAEHRRRIRELDEQLETESGRADLKAKRQEIVNQRDTFELAVFTERQQQYPTDMGIRYELGVRQHRKGLHDEALVSFQQATRDPKRHILALNALGKCFLAKGLPQEAQNQFETAIQQYEITGDPLAKELRYNLAMVFEAQNKLPQAIEWYSGIVQQDYQYRDAAKRLEILRRKASGAQEQA